MRNLQTELQSHDSESIQGAKSGKKMQAAMIHTLFR